MVKKKSFFFLWGLRKGGTKTRGKKLTFLFLFLSLSKRDTVASFLCHSLGVDWRRGAEHFENLLNDSDTASNCERLFNLFYFFTFLLFGARESFLLFLIITLTLLFFLCPFLFFSTLSTGGNWMMAAGFSGNRINVFNIAKQSMDYDPRGEYVMHHLPELQGLRSLSVGGQKIHDPRSLSSEELRAAGLVLGADYPLPIATVPSPHSSADRGNGGGGGRGGRGGRGAGGGGGRGGGGGNRGNERRGGKDPRERRVRDGGAKPATDGGLKGRPLA